MTIAMTPPACRASTVAPTMIDWLTVRIPVNLPRPINGGWFVKVDRDGTIETRTPTRLIVPGSFSSSLTVRAPSTSELEVTGNPCKFLQGHNLYGTDDPIELLWAALLKLESMGDDVLPCSLEEAGLHGPESLFSATVSRIDCTAMLSLETPGDVLSWIRSAHATGTLTHRGRGVMREGTLVYGDAAGRSCTHSQIVLYSKGQEVAAHPLPPMMMADFEVLEWTNRCLRAEVRLGRNLLRKMGLRSLGQWNAVVAANMWSEKMARLDFNQDVAKPAVIDELPRNLRVVYSAWTSGADLREMFSRRTFYRHRRQLLDLANVDIAIPPPTVPTAQIIPLKRVLEAVPAGRPAWADRIDDQLRQSGAIVLSTAA